LSSFSKDNLIAEHAGISLNLLITPCAVLHLSDKLPAVQLIREVRILKYCVRATLRILTKDPHPQADAMLDLLSVRICSDLYTFVNPYNLNIILMHHHIASCQLYECISAWRAARLVQYSTVR